MWPTVIWQGTQLVIYYLGENDDEVEVRETHGIDFEEFFMHLDCGGSIFVTMKPRSAEPEEGEEDESQNGKSRVLLNTTTGNNYGGTKVLGSQIEILVCPRCGGANLVNDPEAGEEVCAECGLVVSEGVFDAGPEWRAFTLHERNDRARTGMQATPMLFDRGLSTNFRGMKDGTGKPLDVAILGKMNRLRRYDHRSKINDSQARNLSIAMPELDRVATLINLSETAKSQAAQIYRKALDKDLVRGRSIEAFVAASIYAVCRLNGIPRSLRNISKVSTREYLEVARVYRILVKELGLKMPIDDSMKFVTSIASKLGIESRTEQRAVDILMSAKKHKGLAGKYPRGVAAAALYLACLENKEKRGDVLKNVTFIST